MVKAEEYQHMALCLEDAMKETNELKSQVRFQGILLKKLNPFSIYQNNQYSFSRAVIDSRSSRHLK